MKIYFTILLSVLLIPFISLAATNDFVANDNITVTGVTFGGSTADMIIFNGSTAESWIFNNGAFTVTNPGSAFQVGSSGSNVKSMKISSGGSVLVCTENTTPGTSYATVPTSSGTYTIEPSSTTDCTTLCSPISNTATYNSYPTCGSATCNSGYRILGSGSSAICVPIGGGGISGGGGGSSNIPTPQQVVIPGLATTAIPKTPEVANPSLVAKIVSPVFNTTLRYGMTSDDIKRLQQLLSQDPEIYPQGIVSGWFGQLTRKAVQKFQKKYGIVSSGDENTTGYGVVGPKTRAKIQEIFGGQTEQIQQKIQDLMDKIKTLQEKLKALQ